MNAEMNLSLPPELVETKGLLRWASYQVTTDTEVEMAGAAIKEIDGRVKAIKKKQDELFGPLKKAIRDFEEKVRDVTNPLKAVSEALRGRIGAFWTARQAELDRLAEEERKRKLAEEQEKARAAMELAVTTGSDAAMTEAIQRETNVARIEETPAEARQTVRTTGYTMAQAKVWSWRITDPAAIPREYLVVDEPALNKVARSWAKLDPKPVIPGVEFFEQSRVVMR